MLNIVYSEKFISQLELLDKKTQKLVEKKVKIFVSDTRHSSLKTHKLNGILDDFFAFSVNHQIRIIFEYGRVNTVHFLKIGNHDIYK